jgi:uncharacterized DUF497 family protein
MQIDSFDWDEGNIAKCQKHGVSIMEIEQLFMEPPAPLMMQDVAHSQDEERFLAVGQTQAGRYIFIAFTIREREKKRLLRPISARYMHDKEVANYERN